MPARVWPALIRCKRTHAMTQITNDRELRQALDSISLTDQRTVGGLMVRSVLKLTRDARIMRAVEVATKPDRNDAAVDGAYRDARTFSVNSYTACGGDADWLAQAEHFVAAAATACLLPENQLSGTDNPAWRAAMQARMAKSCEMIESGEGAVDNEATKEYAIVSEFLDQITTRTGDSLA